MFSYIKNRKLPYFDDFCLNFSIETKIKTIFQISYFNLSKKTKWYFGYTDYGTIIQTGIACKKNPLLYAPLSVQVAYC